MMVLPPLPNPLPYGAREIFFLILDEREAHYVSLLLQKRHFSTNPPRPSGDRVWGEGIIRKKISIPHFKCPSSA